MTNHYITARVPGILFPVDMVFTGNRDGEKIECICITPNTCGKIWITRQDLVIE